MNSSEPLHLLVVDDDTLIHQALKMSLPENWRAWPVTRIEDIHWNRFFHAAFVDLHLKPGSRDPLGLRVIEKLNQLNPQMEIVAMSGDLDRDLMEMVLKTGAQKFLAKPLYGEEVLSTLEKIEAHWNLRNFNSTRENSAVTWIGDTESSRQLRKKLASLRGESSPVLIHGETGTGKEVVARLLNAQESLRPFVAVNMASLPENLIESELFGHVKGAFTGADQTKIGLIEAAQGGDLFLDEIEAFPLSQQAKLLRFLENGEIRRVGAKDSQFVRTRVISASNVALDRLVAQGQFREDLYFRLSSQKIELSPLRERLSDIPLLVEHFLRNEKPKRNKSFSADGLKALEHYSWPGNIRELKRVCEQLSLSSPLPIIREEDVSRILLRPIKAHSTTALDLHLGLQKLMEDFEKQVLTLALHQHQKDVDQVCQVLQMSRSNLYKKIKDHNLELEKI